jgi:hypothetical protein
MKGYWILWGSPDAATNGLYYDDNIIADWWTLRKHGYDYMRIMHWSQKALARVAQEVNGG